MRRPSSALLYLLCLFVGQCLASRSWNGLVYIYMGEERAPAAVRTLDDYVAVTSDVVHLRPTAQLLHSARLDNRAGTVDIHLGNPILRLPDGRMAFACPAMGRAGVYDKIELTFMADGIAESGEVPRLTFAANCQAKDSATELSSLTMQVPSQAETWALTRVRFFSEGESPNELDYNSDELRANRAGFLKFSP